MIVVPTFMGSIIEDSARLKGAILHRRSAAAVDPALDVVQWAGAAVAPLARHVRQAAQELPVLRICHIGTDVEKILEQGAAVSEDGTLTTLACANAQQSAVGAAALHMHMLCWMPFL